MAFAPVSQPNGAELGLWRGLAGRGGGQPDPRWASAAAKHRAAARAPAAWFSLSLSLSKIFPSDRQCMREMVGTAMVVALTVASGRCFPGRCWFLVEASLVWCRPVLETV